MINNKDSVRQTATCFQERILKRCNIAEPLKERMTLLGRKSLLEEKNTEYRQEGESLKNKLKTLNVQIGALIAEGKNPETLSQECRQIKLRIEDIDTWIDESETLLMTVQENIKASTELIHKALTIASAEEKQIVTDELNADLKRIEDKIEAWQAACLQLSIEHKTRGLNHTLSLSSRDVKHHILV